MAAVSPSCGHVAYCEQAANARMDSRKSKVIMHFLEKCIMTLLFLLSILAFAACSQYATCPQDGETAAMIDSGPENGGFVATYAHTTGVGLMNNNCCRATTSV